MSGYRNRRSGGDKKNISIVSGHDVINWCSENFAAKKKYLQSPCKDSYLIILDDGDKHLSCSCGCHYSKKIKEFCSDKKRIERMVRTMVESNGLRLKKLIF